jgi:hypothetical protein
MLASTVFAGFPTPAALASVMFYGRIHPRTAKKRRLHDRARRRTVDRRRSHRRGGVEALETLDLARFKEKRPAHEPQLV